MKITDYHLGQLIWPVSQINLQCNMLGFLMDGHICTHYYQYLLRLTINFYSLYIVFMCLCTMLKISCIVLWMFAYLQRCHVSNLLKYHVRCFTLQNLYQTHLSNQDLSGVSILLIMINILRVCNKDVQQL